jgi:hypothetical protein
VELAGTAQAQRILALHIAARYYTNLIAACERDQPDAGEADWIDSVLLKLTEVEKRVKETTSGYTAALLAWANVSSVEHTVLTILAPHPKGVPVVAVIPTDASKAPVELR